MRESTRMFPQLGELPLPLQQEYGYDLPRHGFARELSWLFAQTAENQIQLATHTTHETQVQYPHDCTLEQFVTLDGVSCQLQLIVYNTDSKPLLCAPGHHTYYRVPVDQKKNITLSDNYEFTPEMIAVRLSGEDTIKIDYV